MYNMYERKIILIKEFDDAFTIRGRTLDGLAKLLCDGKNTKLTLTINNADIMRMGSWFLYLFADGKYFEFERKPQVVFAAPSIRKVSLIITAERIKKFVVGYGSSFLDSIDKELAYRFGLIERSKKSAAGFSYDISDAAGENGEALAHEQKPDGPPQAKDAKDDEPLTEYEKFILSADDYYKAAEEKKRRDAEKAERDQMLKKFETLQNYSAALGRYDGGEDYYASVKDEIASIFDTFPVFAELTGKVENSVWVKISRDNGRFFALGLLLAESRPKYICYALPAKKAMRPDRAQFLDAGAGYWVIAQDAETGKRAKEKVKFARP